MILKGCDQKAAHHKDGSTDAHAEYTVYHVVNIIGVRRQTADGGSDGDFVHLPCGKVCDLFEQILPHGLDHPVGGAGDHEIGSYIERHIQHGKEHHFQAKHNDIAHFARRHSHVNNVRQSRRDQKIHHGAGHFQHQRKNDHCKIRFAVAKYPFHAVIPPSPAFLGCGFGCFPAPFPAAPVPLPTGLPS